MVADLRKYSQGVRVALAALCGGTCYWPGCGEPVVRFVDDDPISNLQVAHIAGALPHGPRYVPSMTEEERKAFTNLILLCHPHHTIVDKLRPQDFSIPTLQKWKAVREAANQEALSRLREVTPDTLQTMIVDALKERDERIDDAIEKLQQVNAEAAQLLYSVLDELQVLRNASNLDRNVLANFAEAANGLDRRVLANFAEAAYGVDRRVLANFAEAAYGLDPSLLERFIRAARSLPDR